MSGTVKFWRWVHVVVAALAMVATLPGRTHGLGVITEPLLRDLQLDRVHYASLNLWATLLGASFCLPCGWLIDRLGTRAVLAATLGALGGVVVAMSRLPAAGAVLGLFVLILLTRGLGQSALSVVSITLVGRSAGRRSGPAIGVYSFITALGFSNSFAAIRYVLKTWDADWRTLWAGIGWILIGFAALSWPLVRPLPGEGLKETGQRPDDGFSFTLGQALRTPAFWVFALTTSFYGMVAAGISFFNQSILEERGFDRDVFLTIAAVSPMVGLAANLATGWLAERWPLGRLLGAAMFLLTTALLSFPFVQTLAQVYLYAGAMGAAGGMVTVLFFAVWGKTFGPVHLGKIQGAAQMLTVLASAVGPLVLATCQRWTGSYTLMFQYGAAAAFGLALWAWQVPVPKTLPAVPQGILPATN